MIVFERLNIDNFMSIECMKFTFERGTKLLLGQNRDSVAADDNGAGKSSIGEALRWVLYGSTVRGEIDKTLGVDHVIRRGAKKTKVSLLVMKDGETYTVTRERTKSKATLIVKGGGYTFKQAAAEQAIANLMGINVVQFANLVHLDGSYPKLFASSTDKDRKDILAELVNIAVTGAMQDEAHANFVRTSVIEQELHNANVVDAGKARVFQDNMVAAKERGKEAKAKIGEYTAQVTSAKADLDELEEDEKNLVETISQLDTKQFGDITELEAKIWDTLKPAIKKATEAVMDAQTNYLISDRTAVKDELYSVQSELNTASNRIVLMRDLQAEGKCPTCSQDTTEVGEEEILKLTSKAERLRHEAEKHRSSLEAIEAKRTTRIAELNEKLADLQTECESRQRELSELHRTVKADRGGLDEGLERVREVIGQVGRKIAALNASISQLHRSVAADKVIYKDSKVQLTQIELEVTNRNKRIAEVSEEKASYEFWKKGFGPKGVPSLFIETVLPHISARIQKYANILSGGDVVVVLQAYRETKSKTIQESIQISAINSKGAACYGSNSTGERNRIDLAVTLGLIEYFRDMGVFDSSLLICDEIFDGLDGTGVEQALRALDTAQIPSAYVVSHHEQLKPLFSETIYVRKENGVSALV